MILKSFLRTFVRTFVLVRWKFALGPKVKFALGPKVVSPFVFACGLASYMMAERATPLPFSPEKVEKAREAINILSRSSSHFNNLTFPYYTVCMRGSSHSLLNRIAPVRGSH